MQLLKIAISIYLKQNEPLLDEIAQNVQIQHGVHCVSVCMCLGLFHPGDRGGLQMLPAADFVTVHKIWGTFTLLLLLEPLFFLIKLQHANTSLSYPPKEGRLKSPLDINNCLVYMPLPLRRIFPVYTGSRV